MSRDRNIRATSTSGGPFGGYIIWAGSIAPDLMRYVANSASEDLEWLNGPICQLSWLGKKDLVELCLAAGASADAQCGGEGPCKDWRPLDFAVSKNQVEVIALLLRHVDLQSNDTVHRLLCVYRIGVRTCGSGVIAYGSHKVEARRRQMATIVTCNGNRNVMVVKELAGDDMWHNITNKEVAFCSTASGGCIKSMEAILRYGTPGNIDFALSQAAQSGCVAMCRLLLDHGARAESERNRGILYDATKSRQLEIVELFLDRGAVIDDKIKNPALIWAAGNECWDIVRFLVEKMAGDPMVHASCYLEAPLYHAIIDGSTEIATFLINAGAPLDLVSPHIEISYLHLALETPAIVKALLKKNADIERESRHGTPLYLASRSYPESIHEILKFGPNTEYVFKQMDSMEDGYTPLRIAISRGHLQAARLLLDAGAKIDAHIKGDKTASLHAAMEIRNEDDIALLLKYNKKLELRDRLGRTPLHLINAKTSVAMVKRIVNRGDIEAREKKNFTPLSVAAWKNNYAVAEYLIKRGADLATPVTGYESPLHIACRYADLKMVKLLLEGGANINITDSDLLGTPLMTTCLYLQRNTDAEKKRIMSHLLNDSRADINIIAGLFGTVLSVACFMSGPEMIRFLLNKKANIGATDDMGRQPVHFAALSAKEHLMLLAGSGADIFAKDKMGRSCLHYAASSGCVDLVEMLPDYMPDAINEEDNDGWTPLLWAARSCGEKELKKDGCPNVINTLLERGADLFVTGNGFGRGWTPAEVAAYHGASNEVMDILIPRPHRDPKYHRVGLEGGMKWDDDKFCSSCLLGLLGEGHICQTRHGLFLCFKCYLSKNKIYPGHKFIEWGTHISHTYSIHNTDGEGGKKKDASLETEDEDSEPDEW